MALESDKSIIPIFIFDVNILNNLPKNDPRVNFIYDKLESINQKINDSGSSILCLKGNPINIWKTLIKKYSIEQVYANKDYEPYAINRDKEVNSLLEKNKIKLNLYKDQVIFEELEVSKKDNTPYTVYTPYKNKDEMDYHKSLKLTMMNKYNNWFENVHQLNASLTW